MIFGVLLVVYGGYIIVWLENKVIEVFGLYVYLIIKYKLMVMVVDYLGLKRVVYNY